MRILFTGVKYHKYQPEAGLSFEYSSFLPALKAFPSAEVVDFPFDRLLEVGREQGRQELVAKVKAERPDLVFIFPYTDELDPATLHELKKYAPTLAWFSDDHWRFDNYSRYLAPYFDAVATTYSKAVPRYQELGVQVIHTQWAASLPREREALLRGATYACDVSFIGSWSRPRQKIISTLQKAGINLAVYGAGWSNGRIDEAKMQELFQTSKINLALNEAPGFWNLNSLGRLVLRRSMDKFIPDLHLIRNFKSYLNRGLKQIKARIFEIPTTGGFMLTSSADNLSDYYVPGKEIILYENISDLIEKTKYYLAHDSEREAIAKAGYERTIREHTYEKRFRAIFERMNLKQG